MKLSSCGLDCSICNYKIENKCEGCYICAGKGECVWGGSCDLYDCAADKNIPHCGKCAEFPCNMLKEWAANEGTDRIDNLKKINNLENL